MAFAGISELHQQHKKKINAVFGEVAKVVVGQEYMVNRLLVGLFTNGHVLLEGVPGLAKTLTISTLAQVLHLDFQRIQFTPDLLPSDLIGTMIYHQKEGQFEFRQRFNPRCLSQCRKRRSPSEKLPLSWTGPFWSWPRKIRWIRRGLTLCPRHR